MIENYMLLRHKVNIYSIYAMRDLILHSVPKYIYTVTGNFLISKSNKNSSEKNENGIIAKNRSKKKTKVSTLL